MYSMPTGDHRKNVDVLVVCTGSTPGNRRSDVEIVRALTDLGLQVGVASTNYGWVGKLPLSLNLLDFTHAISTRLAVTRTLATVAPRVLIYGTAGAAILEPAARLKRAGVRFDSLAVDNRPGHRHGVQRALERRMVRRTALLLPFSSPAKWPELARNHQQLPIALPTPIEKFAQDGGPRQPVIVCYGGAPEKKRLDLLMNAWVKAELPPPYRLEVTGISATEGRRWLRRRRLKEPERVAWRGHLDPLLYRSLTSTAAVYLSASRYEDYGIAQLEALADGALLVTTASPGPYEALALARYLDPRLIAQTATADSLAQALLEAVRLTEPERSCYRVRASALLRPYSREAFRLTLQQQVLPALFDSSSGGRCDSSSPHGVRPPLDDSGGIARDDRVRRYV